MKVRRDEDVANHIGLEPCADTREGFGEASAEDRTGQQSSCERLIFPGADDVPNAEGNTTGRDIASAPAARRSRRTWHVQTLLVRKPGDLQLDHSQQCEAVRVGKARSHSR